MKHIFLLLIFTTAMTYSQAFEKKFQGHWGASNWVFEFDNGGSFERIEQYHFGERRTIGKYTIEGRKIKVILDAKAQVPSMTTYYLLDENDYLIEIDTEYDYKPVSEGVYSDYTSKKRKIP